MTHTARVKKGEGGEEEIDPGLITFLRFLDSEIRKTPELTRPFTVEDVRGVDELLAGAEVDPEEEMGGGFVLP